MVVGAMAISLLPVLFMFFVSYSLLNRTLGRWFPRPLEIASEQTQLLLNDFGRSADSAPPHPRAPISRRWPPSRCTNFSATPSPRAPTPSGFVDQNGNAISGGVICDNPPEVARHVYLCRRPTFSARQCSVLPSGIEIWEAGQVHLLRRTRSR